MNTEPYVPKPDLLKRIAELHEIQESCALSNEKRTLIAQVFLEYYAHLSGLTAPGPEGRGDGWDTIVNDLLTDLLHFGEAHQGLDIHERLFHAERYFNEEMESVLEDDDRMCGQCSADLTEGGQHYSVCSRKAE